MCRVRTENGAVLGIRAPCKVGLEFRTQIPKAATCEVLIRHEELVELFFLKWL